jgi:hypothetical protein
MKIYKEKQFLVFDFEDGKTVKYDFATKECIGKKGKPVNNLCSQLSGLTIDQLCDFCTDKQYGKFLRFVKEHGSYCSRGINNVGTILDRVPDFSRFEQIFSAGIEDIIVDSRFSYGINDIPKALIKLCKNHSIKLSDIFLKYYKENPDGYLLAYNLEYVSLTDADIYKILSHKATIKEYYGQRRLWEYRHIYVAAFNSLIKEYGYTAKALMNYIDYLKTYEAIDDVEFALRELYDYASMMKELSNKFDKYPRHFLTTHKIACRNYNRLKKEFEENKFKSRINKDMERTFGEYVFIYPNCTQDIKTEAASQNNCVASYIQRVIDGECHILFLRKKDSQDKSLVTIEVRDNVIVQAKQKFNDPVTSEQQEAIDKWNKWWSNKINNINKESEESEELKYVS